MAIRLPGRGAPDVIDEFGASALFNTFGGNAVAIRAAAAVLDVIEKETSSRRARGRSLYARPDAGLADGVPADWRCARGRPFYRVEMITDPESKTPDAALAAGIVNGLRDEKVLISGCAKAANVLKIRPPLVFTRDNADHFLAALERVLERTLK